MNMCVVNGGVFRKAKIVSEYDIRGTGGEARTEKGYKWSFEMARRRREREAGSCGVVDA